MTASADVAADRLVFIGGLHRSGTTLLADLLGALPDISSLTDTGVWHDEGQFLQNLFPTAAECGGPGRFARGERAHLTESDAREPAQLREQLLTAWTPFWNLDRKLLVEKSPPNLLRFRYLQTVFPGAHCIAITRHPVAVAYATAGWANASISELLEHWLRAHEIFAEDRASVPRLTVLRYEDLVADSPRVLAGLCATLGVEYVDPGIEVKPDTNARYLTRWRHSRVSPVHPRAFVHRLRYERRLERLDLGYSFGDVS
jgi:hypothetical protein